MNKLQWQNLWRSYRWMLRAATWDQTIAWIAHYNAKDAFILRELTK